MVNLGRGFMRIFVPYETKIHERNFALKAKTELFLYHLLWSAEGLSRPTFRILENSFEAWAYRNGLAQQVAELERECWIERKKDDPGKRIYRLTEKGRLRAIGGRDPGSFW